MAEVPAIETWDSLERIPHPKIRAFADYWQSKRRQRRAPTRADIDPSELGPFLPHMYMLDVLPGPRPVGSSRRPWRVSVPVRGHAACPPFPPASIGDPAGRWKRASSLRLRDDSAYEP